MAEIYLWLLKNGGDPITTYSFGWKTPSDEFPKPDRIELQSIQLRGLRMIPGGERRSSGGGEIPGKTPKKHDKT